MKILYFNDGTLVYGGESQIVKIVSSCYITDD